MKKENVSQVNLKNQEVSKMSTANVPYNNKQLLKWSAFRVEKSEDYHKSYELIHTPLVELVKKPGYEKFKDRLNWLYNNYSKENYQLVWAELQATNERRRTTYIQQTLIAKADYMLNKQIEEWKYHFGEIPAWINKLTDNQRTLLLDRARTCYGLEPEVIELETKQVYTVPQQVVKEYREDGSAIYYSQEELYKTHSEVNVYNDVVGRVKVKSAELQRLAENAVIRDASWLAKFNDTEFDLREHREVEDASDYEERIQQAIEFIEKHRDEYAPNELLQTVLYLYKINPTEYNKNTMVPITDMQGPDAPYGLDVKFRDFLEPIYEDEGL
jgi:hypothetical protein